MQTPKHWMNKHWHYTLTQRGSSYLEAVVATVVLTIVLAVVGPLFVGQRQRNVDSELRTGAAAAAQTTLENFRLNFRNQLPPLVPVPGQNQNQTAMGSEFVVNTQIEDFRGVAADGTLDCSPVANPASTARCIRIQVSHRNNPIYVIQTVYTQLQGP